MTIMGCRLANLQLVIDGFAHTQVPLVLFDGTNLLPFIAVDDVGIYVLIPKLVRLLGISLNQAINLFFYTITGASFILGLVGFFLLYQSTIMRLISTLAILLLGWFLIRLDISEVYLLYLAANLSTIPLFLYFIRKNNNSCLFYAYLFMAGIILATAHYIRSYAGLGALVFITLLLTLYPLIQWRKKIILLGLLAGGFACPIYYFTTIIQEYTNYAQQHFPHHSQLMEHPFWHPLYLGFGFLNFLNRDDIRWDDSCGEMVAKDQNPNVTTTQTIEYEAIIKEKTYLLFKEQLPFVILTLFAKLGILLSFLLIFANIGLLAALFFPKPWYLELTFFCSLATQAIFPLIALPHFCYSLGFITLATLYGILSINDALLKIDMPKIYPIKEFNDNNGMPIR